MAHTDSWACMAADHDVCMQPWCQCRCHALNVAVMKSTHNVVPEPHDQGEPENTPG